MQTAVDSTTEGSLALPKGTADAGRPMRVVCLYPAFDPKVNELALVWSHLAAQGAIDCRAIAGSADALKGFVGNTLRMDTPGFSIRRVQGSIMNRKLPTELLEWAVEHRPDVVVCGEPIAHLGQTVRKATKAPLVLHAENWGEHRVLVPRRYYLGIPFLLRPAHRIMRAAMGRHVSKVIVACPDEADSIKSAADLRVFVPWPHPPPSSAAESRQPIAHAARSEVICIGSIAWWKGSEVMVRYVAKLLEQLGDIQVRIIGPAIDRPSETALNSLSRWRDRCTLVKHMPRDEALKAIGQSLCVFNPVVLRGWGSIGDAWNMKVPVVSVAEHYAMVSGQNALIAPTADAFVAAVQALRKDEGLWKRIARAGHECVMTKHSIEVVAEGLLKAMHNAL
jgi:glycosyltransferase involved in cell wall biosynthesis